jgi:hypothetical protein
MACETMTRKGQSIQDRADEIRRLTEKLSSDLASGRVKPKVGPQGAIVFVGLSDEDRRGVTDSCIYRRLMAKGSALARQAIARAEQLAGRTVDRRVLAQGAHGHSDGRGGIVWHDHKG